MALFDLFTYEGRLRRHARRVANRDAQPEDREASAKWLFADRSDKAIYALLGRFDTNLGQQLKDVAEKDAMYQMLIELGEQVVEPVKEWLRVCKQFAHPLRLLAQLKGDTVAIEMALEMLAGEAQRSAFHPEKKRGLLVWLSEKRHPALIARVAPFLADFDEEVRYAAAEVMIQQDSPTAREPLLAALARPDDDSNRVKHRISEAFRSKGWSIAGAELAGRLPAGFAVEGDRIVAR